MLSFIYSIQAHDLHLQTK